MLTWTGAGLFAAALLTAIVRAVRRITFAPLAGSFIFQVWLLTRFILAPALTLLIIVLVVSLPFSSAASDVLLKAFMLLGFYGSLLVFATAILADFAAMIKSRHPAPPSDG
jgi:hypothetical protein